MGILRPRALLAATLLYILPGAAGASESYRIKSGDTLWELSEESGCSVDQLRKLNAIDDDLLVVGDTLTLPNCMEGKPTASHTIRVGDSLWGISRKYGTDVATLRKLNGLDESSVIVVGKTLRLPGRASAAAPDKKPRAKRGQSVGKPWRGKLVGGAQLEHDRAYYRRRVSRAYGASHVVDATRNTLRKVRRAYPKVHRVAIGDISAKAGGPLSGHRSHQSGRDVDIGLYFRRRPSGYPDEFVDASAGRLHLSAMWKLIELLDAASGDPGGPEHVFLDYRIQGQIYEHARDQGVSKKRLSSILQYPDGRGASGRLVQHEPNHADHLHVRYRCLPRDQKCK